MANYTIKVGSGELNWAASGTERILQNVRNLLSTSYREVAYARDKGLDPSYIDRRPEEAKALFAAQAAAAIHDYEPRARFVGVKSFSVTAAGDMAVEVEVEILE